MAKEERDIESVPQMVTVSKGSISSYVKQSKINLGGQNDGDIFKLTRIFVMDALERENVILDNPTEMYFWLLELRNELKKSA